MSAQLIKHKSLGSLQETVKEDIKYLLVLMTCFDCKMCLPVTSWPCVPGLTAVTEQLSSFTKVACGTKAVEVSTVA